MAFDVDLTYEWSGASEDEAIAIDEIWMDSHWVDVKAAISPTLGWLQVFNLKQKGRKIDEIMLISDF